MNMQHQDSGSVCVVTLSRPARMNALDIDLALFVRDAVQQAMEERVVRALVLCGSGGNFCTGADLRRDRQREQDLGTSLLDVLHDIFRALRFGPKPVIAAVDGYAMGAGLSLVLACDRVVVDASAKLGAPFTGVGLAPDVGMSVTLPERVGRGVACDMLLGRAIQSGAEAVRIGLADRMADALPVLATAMAEAHRFALGAPLAVAATRRMLAGEPAAIEAVLAQERSVQGELRNTHDAREAARAFAEKRAPVFAGR